jgi:RHS repeat-associated protein
LETTGQKGLLRQITYGDNQTITYNYDAAHLNRLASKTERLFGADYQTAYTYDDALGFPLRVQSVTYPTGYETRNVYDPVTSQLYKIENGQGDALWETIETNALGQITRFSTGNGVQSERFYYPATGRLQGIYSATNQNILQNLGYEYDDFGNLAARYDKMRGLRETFGYDALDRLDSIWLNGAHTGVMAYDALGRMTSKRSDGQTVFSSAQHDYVGPDGQLRPHAISSAQVQGNPFPTGQLDIDYTMFDKVSHITDGDFMPSTTDFDYGFDHQRTRMQIETLDGALYEKTYIGNCEIVEHDGHVDKYTFISGPMGVFAVNKLVANGCHLLDSLHYIYKDHLGSWTTVTDVQGNVLREQSFDAWGNMRDPDTWTGTVAQQPMFDRGFTGHEHLNTFGLINMNGRMYDPVTSSFLSVDNYVQCPDFSQNFNRYAYCLNNPLKYTDPSGEELCVLAAVGIYAAIGAAVSMASTATMNFIYDRPLYEGLGRAALVGAAQGAFSYGIGAAAGAINTAVSAATNSTAWGTAAQVGFQMLAHGTLAGMASELRKEGTFWSGFASGAAASLVSGTVAGVCELRQVPLVWAKTAMIAAGGLAGGVSSSIAGGEFIDGFCNGLICAGLNHALHYVADVQVSKYQANKYVEAARAFLVDMGYDGEQVNQDVTVQQDVTFGLYYAKMDEVAFETTYKDAFEGGKFDSYSKTFSAYESKTTISFAPKRFLWTVRTASFTLKYYPDRANSIGIIRAGFSHYVEAGKELFDGGVRIVTGRDNVVYDMHGRNSSDYLYYRRHFMPIKH